MTETPAADQPWVRDLPTVHSASIKDVREAARNPRKIPDRAVELVARSIERFGWKQPLVVDSDGNLIVGHTRYRAARSLGLTHVPIIVADDLTPAEVDAYRVADNRSHDFTTWDLPALTVLLDELSDDFSDVLALTDWEAVTADLESLAGGSSGGSGGGKFGLNLPPEVEHALDSSFPVTVYFASKEEALVAEQAIIGLPGVIDVRHDL